MEIDLDHTYDMLMMMIMMIMIMMILMRMMVMMIIAVNQLIFKRGSPDFEWK